MEDQFSAHQILRRRRSTLIKLLTCQAVQHPDRCAEKLQQYAAQVLRPAESHLATLQISLKQQVKLFICLQESIDQLEKEIAESLAQTQGAFLTSIRGIGIILAAGVSAEIGNPDTQKSLSNLVSYSGIIPNLDKPEPKRF